MRGLTKALGIYFAGVDFSSTRKSGLIAGIAEEAQRSSATLSPDAIEMASLRYMKDCVKQRCILHRPHVMRRS